MSDGYTVRIRGAAGLVVRSWSCPSCGAFDETILRVTPHEARPCPNCGAASEPTLSAPRLKIPLGSVLRGKHEGPRSPLDLDTRPLADGMPYEEWKAKRDKVWADHDRAEMKAKGLT